MRLRIALALAWPLGLAALIYARIAKLGFNVADEGMMAAYTHRLLLGEVPHRDFISPRPVGSAVLHLPDLLVPLPLYLAVRFVGIAEVVLFSVLLGILIFDAAPWRWNVPQALGVAASSLVNLHTFIANSWYTFDGLVLAVGGLLLVRAGIRRRRVWAERAGLVATGLAIVMKQSFFAAPLPAIALLAWHARTLPWRELAWRLVGWSALAVAPMAVYAAVVGLLGGFDEMMVQLLSGRPVWGAALLEVAGLAEPPGSGRPPFDVGLPWAAALVAVLVFGLRHRTGPVLAWFRVVAIAAFVVLVLRATLGGDLAWGQPWSLEVMWVLLLVLATRAVLERVVDWVGVAIAALAWMSMLSWGYDVPALVAGTMALLLVVRALEAWPEALRFRPALALVAPAVGIFLLSAAVFDDARARQPYYDRPEPVLSETVEGFSPEFGAIRTAPATADFMRGLRHCLDRFPAERVAIIPDGPGLYAALDLDNPFPIDWFFPQDYKGSRDRLLDSVQEVAREGRYLILFQTESALFLVRHERLPDATSDSVPVIVREPLIYDAGLGAAMLEGLPGRRVICGSFLAIHRP